MTKQIEVVGAVILRENTVLAAQRGAGMTLPSMWEFPGGKVESGETPQQALRRELQEELLCSVEVGAPVESTTYEYDFGVVRLRTFYAVLTEGEPTPTEHSEVRWIPTSELQMLHWAPADVPAVTQVIRQFAANARRG